nr:uncharacterized protein LOC128691763 [Cherax quadricarinatus]
MTGIPLIRIDGLSDLSSSRFLVDHTNLSTGELTRAQLEWDHLRDTKQPDDYKLNMEGKSLAVIQTDVEEYGDSDLSQGEVEDFILPGLDKKYLEQSLEVMRCQDLSRPEDHSYEVSTISQMKEWHTNTTASEEEGRVGGLPSSLLQPQHSKLKENSFVSGKVHFDVDQISANSTIFRGGLEESKLLSTSCNSLGSIGADMNDVENFSDQSRDDVANEWFEAEQYELASVLEAESFHAPDLDFLEQAEKETCKEFKFLEAGTCDNNLEFSSFSGIYGATEITVRPSWIASPEKNLVGPGNKMLVDDYLKSRSEALGSLGCAEKEKRPNFGTTVHSPPMAGKPIPLIEKSLEEDDASQLHPREGETGSVANLTQLIVFFLSFLDQIGYCVISIAAIGLSIIHSALKFSESIDGCPTAVSALLFKPSYFVEPRNKCEIKLGVCSQFKGLLEAIFEVRVSDLAKGLGTSAAASQVSIQTLIVSANINEPDVQLTCDGEDVLDFGVVPEGCTLTQKVVIINHSPQTLPVVLLLQQVAVTSPIFCWNSEKNEFAKTISPTRLALELPAANNESGPVPQTMNVTLKAPHLDNVKVGENGVVGVRSHMQVELDTPNNSTIIIASFPVKAHIGAVRLESVRTVKSLVLETMANDTCTAPVPLKNSSSFALRVSLESRDHKNLFTVHPNSIVIQPHSQASPNLVFTPQGEEGKMESVLLMRIEPEGMEFEVPIVGISHALPSATVLPQKHVMPGVHETLTKTNSAPLSHVSEKDLASALESTKSRIVFGTVKIGDSSSQKLVVRNNCTTQALSLSLGISGNKAFQVGEFGSKEGQCKMEVVLKPCQELALSIFLCPKEVEPLSATLVCKYRGLTNPFKCKVPLQGYGGKSELEIADACDGKPLFLRDLAPGLPTLVNTTFTNTGDRVMFLKLLVFTDDQCSELLPSSEISVQPSEFVLAPKENRDIFIAATGTANMLAKAPGCVGVLQVISGDEILRQRFRRLKNKEVKIRRINDPSLLKINWDSVYTGKKEVQNEEDCLPPQPEDSAVFFNSCSKIQIQLYGERQAHDDASSTVFACLNADDTVSLEADITAAAGDSYNPQIMCENESRCATITVLPTGGENSAAQSLTVSKQLPSASPPVQQSPVPSTDSLAPKPLIDLQAPELKIPSVRYPSTSANPETTTKTNVANTGRSQTNESEVKHMGSTESLVQLVSDIINFPDTATMKENYVKVKLRNLDGLVHVVRAVVVKGPFALRHTQFSIKSGHYVSVPVYFRPQKAGMYSGQLMLTVLEEQTILPVQLYGRAV